MLRGQFFPYSLFFEAIHPTWRAFEIAIRWEINMTKYVNMDFLYKLLYFYDNSLI